MFLSGEALEQFYDEREVIVTPPNVFRPPATSDLLLLRDLQLNLGRAVLIVSVL